MGLADFGYDCRLINAIRNNKQLPVDPQDQWRHEKRKKSEMIKAESRRRAEWQSLGQDDVTRKLWHGLKKKKINK